MKKRWNTGLQYGRNLAIENSFRLYYRNETQQNQTVNTFSVGSQGTPKFVSGDGIFFPLLDLVNSGVVDNTFKFIVNAYLLFDGANVGIYSTTFIPIGTSLSALPSLTGTITTPFGESTDIWYVEYPISIKLASIFVPNITLPTRLRFTQNPVPPLLPYYQTENQNPQGVYSYNPNNPFVFIGTQTAVPFTSIQNDGVDSTIGILCIDIYSTDPEQVSQSIDYTYKDSNGNRITTSADPVVNPYQPQFGSIRCIDSGGIVLNNESTLTYNLKPLKNAFLTVNYVKFTIWDYYEFDRVFKQQIQDNFLLQKKLLDRNRVNNLQIQ
jgi:hypothetical protein